MNAPTIIVLLVVLGLVVLAIVALRKGKSGSCCESKKKTGGNPCASCSVECPFKSGKLKDES
jgi:hypothetical protein